MSLNKTPSYLKEESCVIKHVIGWLFIPLEHLVLAVFVHEAEARWLLLYVILGTVLPKNCISMRFAQPGSQ